MPIGLVATHKINRMLDGAEADTYSATRDAVRAASSVLDAAERAGVFTGLDDAAAAAARKALGALPKSIDAAYLAVLANALERNLPVVTQWKPGAFFEFQVWEAVDGTAGQVSIMLVTPYARDLS
jgi:hypothetical protein